MELLKLTKEQIVMLQDSYRNKKVDQDVLRRLLEIGRLTMQEFLQITTL